MVTKGPPHGNQIYPWDTWTDGEWHEARRKLHFNVEPEQFRRGLSVHALRVGKKVTTRVKGDVVHFQFRPKDEVETEKDE